MDEAEWSGRWGQRSDQAASAVAIAGAGLVTRNKSMLSGRSLVSRRRLISAGGGTHPATALLVSDAALSAVHQFHTSNWRQPAFALVPGSLTALNLREGGKAEDHPNTDSGCREPTTRLAIALDANKP